VRLKALGTLTKSVTSSGVEPVTFCLVAQCLKHYATVCHHKKRSIIRNICFEMFMAVINLTALFPG
jgi:hypothetical protein